MFMYKIADSDTVCQRLYLPGPKGSSCDGSVVLNPTICAACRGIILFPRLSRGAGRGEGGIILSPCSVDTPQLAVG